jgi:uncharacterized membrane protein
MTNIYAWLKFLHVVAVAVWVGGLTCVIMVNRRISRSSDRAVIAAVAEQTMFLGTRVIATSSGITLIAGVFALIVGKLGFPLWALWGFISFVLFLTFGATAIRVTSTELQKHLGMPETTVENLRLLLRRLVLLSSINLVLLLSAVWAMVFKP